MMIYINGVSNVKKRPRSGACLDGTGNLYLGYNPGRNSDGGEAYFNGLLDEVGWYNRALSADEVVKLATTITLISPVNGPTTGGTSVTITGTNLAGATFVKFGDNSAPITANTATSITTTSPAGSPGTVDITVVTAGGTSATSSADQFTYVAPPTITGISPASGPNCRWDR